MRLSFGYLLAALAVILSIAFGSSIGPYWVYDAIALALLAFAVVMVCLAQTQEVKALTLWLVPTPRETERERAGRASAAGSSYNKYTPRSKIAHFVFLSRIRFTSPQVVESYNPFERALLSRKGWQKLSADELKTAVETLLK